MAKKGLAIFYSPKELHQFIWYYCNKGQGKEWDALCLPNYPKEEYMHTYCQAAGIFSTVFRSDSVFMNLSTLKKLRLFLSMFGYFLIGQQRRFCRKFLNSYVPIDDYDEIFVNCNGLIGGACIVLGREKEVVLLDDGHAEYTKRPKWITKEKLKTSFYREGFILARMGYCATGFYYFDPDKYCIKYANFPEKMLYRNYKEIRQLFAEEGTDQALFEKIMHRIFPSLDKINLKEVDAVFFTRSLSDNVSDYKKYIRCFESFVNERYHNILIKKHPHEICQYHFADHVVCTEIESAIPAEVLLPFLKDKDIYILGSSTILMYTKSLNLHLFVIEFQGLSEESLQDGLAHYISIEEVRQYCDKYSNGNYELIGLSPSLSNDERIK